MVTAAVSFDSVEATVTGSQVELIEASNRNGFRRVLARDGLSSSSLRRNASHGNDNRALLGACRRVGVGSLWVDGTKGAVRSLARNSHLGVYIRRRGRSVRSIRGTVTVLRTTPRKTDAGVANGIALHLGNGSLSRLTLNKLDKATALSRRNLDVGNVTEA